jgi:hypothetical protein
MCKGVGCLKKRYSYLHACLSCGKHTIYIYTYLVARQLGLGIPLPSFASEITKRKVSQQQKGCKECDTSRERVYDVSE